MSMVLAKSSNVGAVRVGLEVGPERMYDYVKRFGFGQKTGIPLPAESRGMLWPVNRWRATSLASISFGHEVTVTTIQLARAASVIANGGMLVKPRLLLKKGAEALPAEPPVRVLKPETAISVRQMMEGVVLVGTGKRAALGGYSSGGKTGSAVIYDPVTKRYTHTYNGSFMGFAPVTNPAIVVVVTLNGTRGESGYGGAASAPVFQVVATEALRVLEVVKDLPEQLPAPPSDPKAVDEDAPPQVEIAAGQPHVLETQPDAPAQPEPEVPGPKTPNFQGMTVRAVFSQAAAKGLTVKRDGSGIARLQDPPAGAPLRAGEPIRVVFSR
jgi:cell division protein FtsI (penicillin-binding protein 3)